MINCAASNSSQQSSVDVNNSKKKKGLLTGKGGRCLILAIIGEPYISVRSIFHFFGREDGGGELAQGERIVVSSSCLLSKQATSLSFMFN